MYYLGICVVIVAYTVEIKIAGLVQFDVHHSQNVISSILLRHILALVNICTMILPNIPTHFVP